MINQPFNLCYYWFLFFQFTNTLKYEISHISNLTYVTCVCKEMYPRYINLNTQPGTKCLSFQFLHDAVFKRKNNEIRGHSEFVITSNSMFWKVGVLSYSSVFLLREKLRLNHYIWYQEENMKKNLVYFFISVASQFVPSRFDRLSRTNEIS